MRISEVMVVNHGSDGTLLADVLLDHAGPPEGVEDLPTIYIGEGDVVRDRIDSHSQSKDFWEQAYAFTTSNNGLNKAHARWTRAADPLQCVT